MCLEDFSIVDFVVFRNDAFLYLFKFDIDNNKDNSEDDNKNNRKNNYKDNRDAIRNVIKKTNKKYLIYK